MILEIHDKVLEIAKSLDIVNLSGCKVLEQSDAFNSEMMEDLANDEPGFAAGLIMVGMEDTIGKGRYCHNISEFPVASYKFDLRILHNNSTEAFKKPLEVLQEFLKIHNISGKTESGRDFQIILESSPWQLLETTPCAIYAISIEAIVS